MLKNQRKLNQVDSISLFLCICFAINLVTALIKTREDEWKTIHSKLYSLEGKFIGPDETLQLLKRLVELNHVVEFEKIFIEASKVTDEKCQLRQLISRDIWIGRVTDSKMQFPGMSVNIIPYLKFYRNKQRSYCSVFFEQSIKNVLDNLDKGKKKAINVLREHFNSIELVKDKDGDLSFKPEQLSYSVLALMGIYSPQDLELLRKKVGPEFDFEIQFNKYVTRLCGAIPKELESNLHLFKIDLINSMAQSAVDWLKTAQVCRHIMDDQFTVIDDAHEIATGTPFYYGDSGDI